MEDGENILDDGENVLEDGENILDDQENILEDGENIIGDEKNIVPEPDFRWNHSNILLFLDEFQKRIQKFRNPSIKKKTFWREISKAMNSKGYNVNADTLDRKMRNMKATFTKIKDNNKKSKTGRGRVNWEYFERFNEIFAEDKTINISNVITSIVVNDIECRRETENAEKPREILTPLPSPSGASCSGSDAPSNCREKQKRLDSFRKRQIELDEQRVEELKKIRLEIAESNRISREKLELFKQFLNQ